MIDASTQTDPIVARIGKSSHRPLPETQTGKKSMTEASTQTNDKDAVDSSSTGSPSSPTTLVNTPTDHSSTVDAEDDEQKDESGFEDFLLEAQIGEEQVFQANAANQELRDENAQLKSSIDDLKEASSQEKEKSAAAAQRATAAEGRAAAAEERVAVVVARATNLGMHMESLAQDLGNQMSRAARAEAEVMRLRLQMWNMQRHACLPSDEEAILDQDYPSNTLDQTQEMDAGSRVPLDAQELPKSNVIRGTPTEEPAVFFRDVAGNLAATASTKSLRETLVSTDLAANRQVRGEHAAPREQITKRDCKLYKDRSVRRKLAGSDEQAEKAESNLQTQPDEANFRISESEVSNVRRRSRTKLHVSNSGDHGHRVQLAVEGPPARPSAMQNEGMTSHGNSEQDGDASNIQAEAPAFNNFSFQNIEDVIPSRVPAATSESAPKSPAVLGPLFTFGTPTPAIQPEAHDTSKKPIFKFGETPASGSERKAKGTVEFPVPKISATTAQDIGHCLAPGVIRSPQGLDTSQQAAVPEVSGVQEASKRSGDEGEGIDEEDEGCVRKCARRIMLNRHKVTGDHTSATFAPRLTPFAPVTPKAGEAKPVGTPVYPTVHTTEKSDGAAKSTLDFNFGETASVFGAKKDTNSVPNGNAESKLFESSPINSFNCGESRSFTAGPKPFKAGLKAFDAVSTDEEEEALSKRSRNGSKTEAPSPLNVSPSSPGTKRDKATKKTKTSVFDAAASVTMSSLSCDSKSALGAPFGHEDMNAMGTPKVNSKGGFNFPGTVPTVEEKRQEPALSIETTPSFVTGMAKSFCFSSSGVTPTFGGFKSGPVGASTASSGSKSVEVAKKNKVEISAKKAANAPLFTAQAFANFDIPASHGKERPDQFNFGAAGDASSPVPKFVLFVTEPEQERNNVDSEVRVDENRAEASGKSSTLVPTSKGSVKGGPTDVLGKLGFDVAALSRIVNYQPAVPKTPGVVEVLESLSSRAESSASHAKKNEVGGDISQSPSRSAAEIFISWEVECRERAASSPDGIYIQETPTKWRDPEWAAALPPSALTVAATHQPPTPTQTAVSNFGPYYGTGLTIPSSISDCASHMSVTAPITIRNEDKDWHTHLIEVKEVEGGIQDAMAAIESLYIGPPSPPPLLQRFDPDLHLLSGDWVARRFVLVRTMQRQKNYIVKYLEKIERESRSQTKEVQERKALPKNKRIVQQEIAGKSEPQETDSVCRSSAEVGLEAGRLMAPQPRPQLSVCRSRAEVELERGRQVAPQPSLQLQLELELEEEEEL